MSVLLAPRKNSVSKNYKLGDYEKQTVTNLTDGSTSKEKIVLQEARTSASDWVYSRIVTVSSDPAGVFSDKELLSTGVVNQITNAYSNAHGGRTIGYRYGERDWEIYDTLDLLQITEVSLVSVTYGRDNGNSMQSGKSSVKSTQYEVKYRVPAQPATPVFYKRKPGGVSKSWDASEKSSRYIPSGKKGLFEFSAKSSLIAAYIGLARKQSTYTHENKPAESVYSFLLKKGSKDEVRQQKTKSNGTPNYSDAPRTVFTQPVKVDADRHNYRYRIERIQGNFLRFSQINVTTGVASTFYTTPTPVTGDLVPDVLFYQTGDAIYDTLILTEDDSAEFFGAGGDTNYFVINAAVLPHLHIQTSTNIFGRVGPLPISTLTLGDSRFQGIGVFRFSVSPLVATVAQNPRLFVVQQPIPALSFGVGNVQIGDAAEPDVDESDTLVAGLPALSVSLELTRRQTVSVVFGGIQFSSEARNGLVDISQTMPGVQLGMSVSAEDLTMRGETQTIAIGASVEVDLLFSEFDVSLGTVQISPEAQAVSDVTPEKTIVYNSETGAVWHYTGVAFSTVFPTTNNAGLAIHAEYGVPDDAARKYAPCILNDRTIIDEAKPTRTYFVDFGGGIFGNASRKNMDSVWATIHFDDEEEVDETFGSFNAEGRDYPTVRHNTIHRAILGRGAQNVVWRTKYTITTASSFTLWDVQFSTADATNRRLHGTR